MVKTLDQLKNMTEDYIKITEAKYQNSTEKIREKNPEVEWQFLIDSGVHITMAKKRPDRIRLHIPSIYEGKDIEAVTQLLLSNPEFTNSINEFILLRGCTYSWLKNKEGKINGFIISSYIDSEIFDRPKFFEAWDKITITQKQIIQKIGIRFNPKQTKPTDSDTSEKSMYG